MRVCIQKAHLLGQTHYTESLTRLTDAFSQILRNNQHLQSLLE